MSDSRKLLLIEDDASFAKLWSGPQRVFFITDKPEKWSSLASQGGGLWTLYSYAGKSIVSNRPS